MAETEHTYEWTSHVMCVVCSTLRQRRVDTLEWEAFIIIYYTNELKYNFEYFTTQCHVMINYICVRNKESIIMEQRNNGYQPNKILKYSTHQ